MIRRLQLLEIHEQPWCPAGVRNGATDCLNLLANVGRQYHNVPPLIRKALHAMQSDRVIDLCSGGGGPWFTLARQLATADEAPVQVFLTDRYPSETAMQLSARFAPSQIHYLTEPVDATRVSSDLVGFRTLFTAFHHFPPPTARAILQDAADNRQGIGIFEQTRRDPLAMVLMLALPLIALLTVPFIPPFRWSRLFWTYLIPAIPCVLCIDGVISCLRTYSLDELETLIRQLHAPGYAWEIGRVRSPISPVGVTYALLYPAPMTTQSEPSPKI